MITIDPPLETLSVEERLELIEKLQDSLVHEDEALGEQIDTLLTERLARANRGEGSTALEQVVFARLQKRYEK